MDMESKACVNEDADVMVLRCRNYPQKGSQEWTISGNTIEIRVMEKEGKNRIFSISDMRKARVRIFPSAGFGQLTFMFKLDGRRSLVIPDLMYELDDDDIVRRIYNHIAERNPNISPLPPPVPAEPEPEMEQEAELPQSHMDETTVEATVHSSDNRRYIPQKAPGRIVLRAIGIIYIAIGAVLTLGLLMGIAPAGMIIQASARLYIGIFAVAKCNDLTRSDTLQYLALFNLFLIAGWMRDHILIIVIIAVLSILFLVAAVKNHRTYQWLLLQGISVEELKGNSKEPVLGNAKGKTLLIVVGILLIIFAVIAIGYILRPSIMIVTQGDDPFAWFAMLLLFLPLCLCLFSGIFGVMKSSDLNKAGTLRRLAITTTVLFGGLGVLGAFPPLVLTIGLALLVPFFIGAQMNYAEYKKLQQQQEER